MLLVFRWKLFKYIYVFLFSLGILFDYLDEIYFLSIEETQHNELILQNILDDFYFDFYITLSLGANFVFMIFLFFVKKSKPWHIFLIVLLWALICAPVFSDVEIISGPLMIFMGIIRQIYFGSVVFLLAKSRKIHQVENE